MKNLIITIGAILLMTTILYFQADCNEMIRYRQLLKFAADEGAATASVCISAEEFSKGSKIYDDSTAVRRAGEIMSKNLPGKTFSFIITLQDDSGIIRVYDNSGNLMERKEAVFVRPRVDIRLNGGIPRFRLAFLKPTAELVVRSSYEYIPY